MATTPPKKTAGRKPVAAKKAPAKKSFMEKAADKMEYAMQLNPTYAAGKTLADMTSKAVDTYRKAKPAKGGSKMAAGIKAVAKNAGSIAKSSFKKNARPYVPAARAIYKASVPTKRK